MKKFFCCHKGESSSGAVEAEEQTQPLQPVQLQPSSSQPVQDPQASSRSVKDENEAIFDENLFDNNEGLNLAWRNLWKSYEDAKGSFLVSPSWNTLFTLFLGLLLSFWITTSVNLRHKFHNKIDLGFLFIVVYLSFSNVLLTHSFCSCDSWSLPWT